MQTKRKINVFISSKCNGKYTCVRKALAKMIEDTGLATTYVFENESGSSSNLPEAYLSNVKKCDVFVLLVDNYDSISDATLSEYSVAKASKKRMLCFFCDERKKSKTEVQIEIENTRICKYEVVHCFSDLTAKVFDALMQDLVDEYIDMSLDDIKEIPLLEPRQRVVVSSERLTKEMLAKYAIAENPIANKLFGESKKPNTASSQLSDLLTYFFNVVLAECEFDKIRFRKLKELILEKHSDPVKGFIKIRLEAFEHYYADDIDACINSLKQAVAYFEANQSMALWLLNDVAIDLRNIIYIRSNRNRQFELNNDGQNIIDKSDENVIFPEIDRIAARISENASKLYKKIELQSPYTTTISGYHEVFGDITSYFTIAMLYGSITYIRLLPAKCAELLLPLCLETHNITFYAEYIKDIILANESKDLDESLRTASLNTRLIPFLNVESLLGKIKNMPISEERSKARINMLKHFGYYYSDSTFLKEEEWFFSHLITQDMNAVFGNINQLVFETIRKCSYRFSQDKIAEYCIRSIQSKNLVLIKNCTFLLNDLDFLNVKTELQEEIEMILIENVNKSIFWEAIIRFGYRCTINWEKLKDAVKDNAPTFYSDIFSLEFIFKEKTDLYKQILKIVSKINSRNETQGSCSIVGYADDLYGTIWNIIQRNCIQLTWDELKPILSACEGTILSEKQVFDAKMKAISLILNVKHYYSQYSEWQSWGERILCSNESVINGFDFHLFDKTSHYSVSFAYEVFRFFFNTKSELDIQILNLSAADRVDIIKCTEFLSALDKNLMDNFPDEIKVAILQLAITLSSNKETDIRFYAVKLLIWLTNTNYAIQAIRQLSQCFDNGNMEIKAAILYRIKEIHDDSASVDFIKQKALVDPNYWIRSIINDYASNRGTNKQ